MTKKNFKKLCTESSITKLICDDYCYEIIMHFDNGEIINATIEDGSFEFDSNADRAERDRQYKIRKESEIFRNILKEQTRVDYIRKFGQEAWDEAQKLLTP